MDKQPFSERPTIRAHKRQFIGQVLVPMIVVILIILIACGLVIADVVSGQGQTRAWADVSLIWLIAPSLLFALAFLAVLVTTIYGMAKLLQVIPPYTGLAQGFFGRISTGTRKLADGAVKPAVWIHQMQAVVRSIIKH